MLSGLTTCHTHVKLSHFVPPVLTWGCRCFSKPRLKNRGSHSHGGQRSKRFCDLLYSSPTRGWQHGHLRSQHWHTSTWGASGVEIFIYSFEKKKNSFCFVLERALLMMVGHGSVPTTLQLWPLPSLNREVSFLSFSPHLGSVDVYEPRPRHCSPPHKTNILEETISCVNSIIAICTISLILVPVALFCFCSLDLLAVGCNSLDLLTPLTSFWNR